VKLIAFIYKVINRITILRPLFAAAPLSLWGLYLRFKARADSGLWVDEVF